MAQFRPLHDRVLVRRIEAEEKTAGGIIIPDTAKEKPQEGEVVSVGTGTRADDGKVTPLDVKAGDRILFGKWSGIELKDKFENMGAQMLREVASKANDKAGDGTTTATVLAQAIVREGMKSVAAGMNPMDLKRGIDLAVTKVVETIKAQSKPVSGTAEIAQVGIISANGDTEVGEKIAEAMEKVGKEGVITVEEAKGLDD